MLRKLRLILYIIHEQKESGEKIMYKISEEQRKQLLQYLMAKPYAEVVQVVAILASLKPIESNDKSKKDLS